MPKTSSDDSSGSGRDDAIETTNISLTVENYCKRTFKWASLLYAEIIEILVSPGEDAQLLKELENILAALDDGGVVMKCLITIEVKLKKANVEEKLKEDGVTTPPIPSKRRKTTDVKLPVCKSKGVTHTMKNLAKFAALFEIEAIRLNRKNEYGSADASRIYQLEKDATLSKEALLKTRENLKKGNVNGAMTILKSALEKDPSNARVVLQMIDLALQRSTVDEQEVVQIMDDFLTRENIDIDQKVLFAQRKVEFLEDFGKSVAALQDAQRSLQAALSKANEAKNKSSESQQKKTSKEGAQVSTSASATSSSAPYNNSYYNSGNSSAYYGNNQYGTQAYGDCYSNYYNNYSNYGQWNYGW